MALTERTKMLEQACKEKGQKQPETHFQVDYHYAGNHLYSDLEKWEKLARSMQYALVNQDVWIEPYDKIIGRTYHFHELPVEEPCPELDYQTKPTQRAMDKFEGYKEMVEFQLFADGSATGHISWFWDRILHSGISGMRDLYTNALRTAQDKTAEEFYSGVLILLDAVTQWNQKHVQQLEKMGMTKMAELCKKVPEQPATTFHEAVQAFFFQHIMVMKENPFGGNSPGRLDYYLWPYLERDLQTGACSLEEARALVDELFLRMDERIHPRDGFVETISLGGCHVNGTSAVNPLTYIMIESIMDLNITHPHVYIRVPENPPQKLIDTCVNYLRNGGNRAQILNDKAIIKALMKGHIPFRDAVGYACGGCMEISPQGMNSDLLYSGWHNIAKYVELAITGGICLVTGKKLQSVRFKGLEHVTDFEEFYCDFEQELKRIISIFFHVQDIFSEESQTARPSYLLSSMLDDCLLRGRNMHGGGVRYHNYGSGAIGMPNAADALFAVKKAVFDDKFCTAQELVEALKANFEGFENLRLRLKALPKYGQHHKEADEMANRVMTSVCHAYGSYKNRFGGSCNPVVLTFKYAPMAGKMLGASADGNFAGKPVAQGITPQSSSMTQGITAAIESNLAMPMELFSGGASTMWDMDPTWATNEIVESILVTFLKGGGQIFQGNITDVKELKKAQKKPGEYGNLIVRVGGYSARFTNLEKALQDEIISRYRHNA